MKLPRASGAYHGVLSKVNKTILKIDKVFPQADALFPRFSPWMPALALLDAPHVRKTSAPVEIR